MYCTNAEQVHTPGFTLNWKDPPELDKPAVYASALQL